MDMFGSFITTIKVVSYNHIKPELHKKKVATYASVSTDYEIN